MAPIHTLLVFALSLSQLLVSSFSDSLIALSNQNPNSSLILIAVHIFLFFQIPLTFTSTIILLLLHVAIPQSDYIKHLTMATEVLVSAFLLFGTPLMVHMAFTNEAVTLYTVKFMLLGAAAAAMYKYDLFNGCISYARQTAGNSVPAFLGLCILASTFLLIGPFSSFSYRINESTLVPIPIGLLFFSLNYFNFLLAMVLLFLHISVPANRPQVAVPAVLIEYLVKALLVMNFTIVLIGLCMIVEFLVGIM